MKNKLIYPIYGILFVFFLSIGKLVFSKENDSFAYPGTRWLQIDNFIGASKSNIKKDAFQKSKGIEIEPIEFAEETPMPVLPNLPDVPLTEEDK